LPGFDAVKVRRWQDEYPSAWRSAVRAFVAGYPEAATAIRTALDTGERARAGDLLHRLRGAAGALGAENLTATAERLERALADNGPIDADLRTRFFASAEDAVKVLAGLEPTESEVAYAVAAEPGCGEQSQRRRELAALLETGNFRALDHLPWLERCLGTEASGEGKELLRQIEALDFPGALETLRRLEEGVAANPR
jgi:HPt (histidine-containing phosphotransfer) domain-containing protein